MPICKDCNSDYEITDSEKEFYEGKKDEHGQPFSLPKRCKSCRVKRKSQKRPSNY